jgi:hypothetical protein
MTTFEEVLREMPASTATEAGLSYYSSLHECATRVAKFTESKTSREEKDYFEIGSCLHWLQYTTPEANTPSGTLNENQEEAVRLYKGWCQFYGSLEGIGLRIVAREEPAKYILPSGEPFTIRPDTLVEIELPGKFQHETGLALELGTQFLVDWKTAQSTRQATYYTMGLQARFYPPVYEAIRGTRVAGMLLIELVRHTTMRKTRVGKSGPSINFHWALNTSGPHSLALLDKWVCAARIAEQNRIQNLKSCVDMQGNVCPFFSDCHSPQE